MLQLWHGSQLSGNSALSFPDGGRPTAAPERDCRRRSAVGGQIRKDRCNHATIISKGVGDGRFLPPERFEFIIIARS
jgi:hypothetical protein